MKSFQVTGHKKRWIAMAVLTVAIAVILSPWASPHPDGLERVAEDHGFLNKAFAVNEIAVIPDYHVPNMSWTAVSVGLAGFSGIIIMAFVLWGLTRSLLRNGGDRHGQHAWDRDRAGSGRTTGQSGQ